MAFAQLLVALLFLHETPWWDFRDAAPWWALVPFILSALLVGHGLLSSRRIYSLPDIPGIISWLAAGFLELHALIPLVAGSRIVTAPLFMLFAWFMPVSDCLLASAVVSAWVLLFHTGNIGHAIVGTAGDAALFLSTGFLLSRWLPWPQGFLQLEIRRRSSAGPVERNGIAVAAPSHPGEESFPTDRLDRLRRQAKPEEGIRRVVEGVLPLAGDARIFYSQGIPPRIVVCQPPDPALTPGAEVPDELRSFASGVLSSRRSISASGGPQDPGFVLVPVSTDSGVEGIIGAYRPSAVAWEEALVPMLEQGAFFIGRELDLKRKIDEIYWEVDRADRIYRLVQRIAEAAERSRESGMEDHSRRVGIYRITAESVRDHLDARRVLLIQVQLDGKLGRIGWEAGEHASFEKPEAWEDLGDSLVEWVARKGESRQISPSSGLAPLPHCWSEPEDGGAILLPVSLPDGFLGVMVCLSRAGEEGFGKLDILRGTQFINVMRMGISHTEEVERLSDEAQKDGLTGLLNRKTFCSTIEKVLSRLDLRRPCAVLMLDIDHFKRINDGYGHPAGDEVIRTVAFVIDRTVRKGDFAGRYGGEEFVLYLEDVDAEKAIHAAERLRLLIRNVKYNFSGKEISVTASIGVACYPDHGTHGEELLKRADEALYRSKAGGRDRVTRFAPQD